MVERANVGRVDRLEQPLNELFPTDATSLLETVNASRATHPSKEDAPIFVVDKDVSLTVLRDDRL